MSNYRLHRELGYANRPVPQITRSLIHSRIMYRRSGLRLAHEKSERHPMLVMLGQVT